MDFFRVSNIYAFNNSILALTSERERYTGTFLGVSTSWRKSQCAKGAQMHGKTILGLRKLHQTHTRIKWAI